MWISRIPSSTWSCMMWDGLFSCWRRLQHLSLMVPPNPPGPPAAVFMTFTRSLCCAPNWVQGNCFNCFGSVLTPIWAAPFSLSELAELTVRAESLGVQAGEPRPGSAAREGFLLPQRTTATCVGMSTPREES